MAQLPALIRFFNPLARRMLGFGIPMGPNALLTVRGRKSGLPRTTLVALVEADGRRWVIGAFGEVNWVRNLRAAREVVIRVGGRPQRMSSKELSREEAVAFYREVLVL